MAGNANCTKNEHSMHLCALKAEGFDKKNPDKFKALTDQPKYKCDSCGSKANKAENLCTPVKL